jgi:DNA-binding transcriptional LysR family regulator
LILRGVMAHGSIKRATNRPFVKAPGVKLQMEMQQVRYFIAVAKTLNFTRAAEDCNVTQPALTRAIKLLEYELGGDLIRREGRHTHLTELGNKMLPILRQCHEAALAAKLLASAVSKGDVSTLSIAVARSLDSALIMGPLQEMYPVFPGIQIKLKRGNGMEIAVMLKSGEADLAMGGPLGVTWDRLEASPMFSESFDLVVGADHALAKHHAVDLDVELIREEQFLLLSGADLTDYELERLGAAGISLGSAHEVDSDRDLEALLTAGFGIAVAPAHALRSETVLHLNLSGLDVQRTVAIYTVAGRPRSREVTALLNLLRGKDWSASKG